MFLNSLLFGVCTLSDRIAELTTCRLFLNVSQMNGVNLTQSLHLKLTGRSVLWRPANDGDGGLVEEHEWLAFFDAPEEGTQDLFDAGPSVVSSTITGVKCPFQIVPAN